MDYGFLVELKGHEFLEGTPTWIQAFPYGTWHHPQYGEISVTPEKAARMAANVKGNIRGQELDIDYDHKSKTDEAAGWVKDAQVRSDGLWLAVEWTKAALTKIQDKAYKYFSPEYTDEWEDPRTKIKYQDVLFGGGITNRPFLKGILPLNLSEAFEADEYQENGGGTLDPKVIRQLLKLSEDATDEDVTNKLSELMEPKPGEKKPELKPGEVAPKPGDKNYVEPTDNKLQVLAETDPLVKGLVEQIAQLQAANRLSEVNFALSELEKGSTDFAIPPAVLAEARTIALEAPKSVGDKVIALLAEVRKAGVIDLRQHRGVTSLNERTDGDSATKRYNDAIQKTTTERKLSYADAASVVASEDPQLFDEYRNESYTRERGL